ncbi:hypothetical protein DEA8626_01847 [Defluviimonas aquaemixtae]|uniref:Hedgehog/Intein (Hint) domain-containing protein n=1 Tax=Albidovulum aquaemixtae TaxID=1542388 RepID=A0A2R8B6N4_9RHOB|nr:Hint domain-containing protein [Defluviimonas aquaemixtae]SPH18311.1 hypothetical protein DEA8626_01847 [Defluviimonas aquaemixtae]
MNDEHILSAVVEALSKSEAKAPPAPSKPERPRRSVEWTIGGFCDDARVTTSFGELPIQALRRRDPLRTVEGPLARVERVDRIQLDEAFLEQNPDAQPVRIQAGALGPNRPKTDVLVSPHQAVGVGQYGNDFRRARDLLDRPGVVRQPALGLSYYVFQCEAPATVEVEGLSIHVSP